MKFRWTLYWKKAPYSQPNPHCWVIIFTLLQISNVNDTFFFSIIAQSAFAPWFCMQISIPSWHFFCLRQSIHYKQKIIIMIMIMLPCCQTYIFTAIIAGAGLEPHFLEKTLWKYSVLDKWPHSRFGEILKTKKK